MQRSLITTGDGSHSIEIPDLAVTYHSRHGAIQESQHVFLDAGLLPLLAIKDRLNVLEMGFGTGLNALLTFIEAEKQSKEIYYETIELFPLETAIALQLNYCAQLGQPALQPVFEKLHQSDWNKTIRLADYFIFQKNQVPLREYHTPIAFDLIMYDAFAPAAQPELWTEAVFQQLAGILTEGGVLVTYCSKGDVRRAMQASGFAVEKIPGPPGKREMVRATRIALTL